MMNSTMTTELQVREHLKSRRESKTRVYDDIPHEDPPTGPLCSDPDCKNWLCNNGRPEVDHRVWKAWRRRVIAEVRAKLVPVLAEHYGLDEGSIRLSYSQKAGCSCGCSPGWIVEAPASLAYQANDVWVSPPPSEKQLAEVEARRIERDAVL